MAPPPIRIRIGASVDASMEKAYTTVEQRGIKAQQRVNKAAADGARNQTKEAERLAAAQERLIARTVAANERAERKKVSDAERATARRIANEERAAAAEERALTRAEKARERANRSFARRTSGQAMRSLLPDAPLASMARRGLLSAAQGMGVDTNISSIFGRVTEQERMAIALSNQGYTPDAVDGDPRNRERVDPNAIINQSRGLAKKYGIRAEDSMAALGEYTAIAGDFAAARDALDELGKLSRATGTDIKDMAAAAGNVDQQLGNIPNKAEVVSKIMRVIAGQGKLGGVEIKDMATQMARVAAAAGGFTGDRGKNIEFMGALAQLARGKGGAPSAAEGARSVVGFANTFIKGQRVKEFDKAGVDVYTDAKRTSFRSPQQIIEESLLKTGGNLEKLNRLFKDTVAMRAVTGAARVFNDAGGGEAGIAEVRKQLELFTRQAKIGQAELDESAARGSNSTEARAEKFNASLQDTIDKVKGNLVPAMERSSGAVLAFAETVGNVATWALENPKTAIAGAITASIARAGIESALRSGIEIAIGAAQGGVHGTGGYTRGSGFMGGMGVAGNLAAGVTIAAMGVTTLTVGMAIIDTWMTKKDKEDRERHERSTDATNTGLKAQYEEDQGNLLEAKRLREEQLEKAKAAIAETTEAANPSFGAKATEAAIAPFAPFLRMLGLEMPGQSLQDRSSMNKDLLQTQVNEQKRATDALIRLTELIEMQGIPGVSTQGAD